MQGGGGGGRKGSGTKIFLGGLPASVNESDLHAFFSEYGKVSTSCGSISGSIVGSPPKPLCGWFCLCEVKCCMVGIQNCVLAEVGESLHCEGSSVGRTIE